jgi:hypothetical protein
MRTPDSAPRVVPPQRLASGAALLLAAMVASGCSFSWDSSGISDIFLGNRKASDIVKGPEEPPKPDAPAGAPAAPEEDSSTSLRRIAILPVAYTDGATAIACDLCPPDLAWKPTGPLQARLATGFIYEAISRHPRFLFPTPDVVDRTMAGTASQGMRETAAALAKAGLADWVVATALVEQRQRLGDDESPERTAGVTMYAALVDARTGNVVWSDTFDQDQSHRNFLYNAYDLFMNDRPVRYQTADAYTEVAVDELIEDLVDELD